MSRPDLIHLFPRLSTPHRAATRFYPTMRVHPATLCASLSLLCGGFLGAQSNWSSYGQDQGATRFSKLAQINTANVRTLDRAWTFHTGANGANEATPLVVDSVMYLSAGNGYFAVDAIT